MTIKRLRGQALRYQCRRGQALRYQCRLAQRPGRPDESLPQRLALIEGVCAQDPDAAAAAMQAHISSVARAIRATKEA